VNLSLANIRRLGKISQHDPRLNIENVVVNRPAVGTGLAVLDAGAISPMVIPAYDRWLGGETFVSFDKEAVKLLSALGQSSRLLSARSRGRRLKGGEPPIYISRRQAH
jgi:hypothetical protein